MYQIKLSENPTAVSLLRRINRFFLNPSLLSGIVILTEIVDYETISNNLRHINKMDLLLFIEVKSPLKIRKNFFPKFGKSAGFQVKYMKQRNN